uniref:Chloride anion exchanger-like n=1 Tax=Labrus bergylta TaxID=56723 RepID=A0A3Q3GW66_9LABR
MPHHTTLYHTTPHYTTPHHTIPHHTILYHTTPHYTTPHHTIPHHTTLYHTTPHHTIPHHTILYHTTPHYTTPHHTTPHYTTTHIPPHTPLYHPHHTIPHHTTLYHTIPHHTIPHHTILYHTTPRHTTPYYNTPHHTIPHHTTPYYTTPHHTILYHTTPHYTTPHHTIPHHTTPHYTTPHHTTLYHTIPHHTTPHHTIPHHTTPHHTIPHHTTPHHTILYHTTPHYTTPHHTIPHHTTPHYTTPHHTIPHHTTPYYTTPHHTTPYYTTPHHTTPYHTILYHTTPHYTTPHHTTPHHTIPHNTTPHHAIPHHTSPYHTTPYYTTPHHTTPHHTIPYHTIPYHIRIHIHIILYYTTLQQTIQNHYFCPMQLAMGLLQVGFIVVYLSDTLVSGFTTAAAVHILVSQLKFVLGLHVPGISGPLALIYTIIACGVSYGFNFEKTFDVAIVGKMVSGYESPIAPNIEVFKESAVEAFPAAIVGFAVAFSVAKVYSIKHDYTIDGNQELIAFGVSNIFGASFRSFAASTALSRTAVQESSGGRTQVAGLISALMAMIVTLALGFLLEPLPRAVLGALVIVNLKGMLMQFREILYLWRRDKIECVVWVVTCLAAILLGLDLGLAVGLGIELLTVVFRTQFPRCSVLANISGTDLYRDRKDYTQIFEPQGVKIFRIPSPIFFANIDFFKDKLIEAVGFKPLKVLRKRNKALRKIKALQQKGDVNLTEKGLRDLFSQTTDKSHTNMEEMDLPSDLKDLPSKICWNAELPASISVPRVDVHSVILDFSAVSFMDISAMKGLKAALREFIHIDVNVYVASCDPYILETLHSCMFFDDEIQTSLFFPTVHDAMLHVLENHKTDIRKGNVVKDTRL